MRALWGPGDARSNSHSTSTVRISALSRSNCAARTRERGLRLCGRRSTSAGGSLPSRTPMPGAVDKSVHLHPRRGEPCARGVQALYVAVSLSPRRGRRATCPGVGPSQRNGIRLTNSAARGAGPAEHGNQVESLPKRRGNLIDEFRSLGSVRRHWEHRHAPARCVRLVAFHRCREHVQKGGLPWVFEFDRIEAVVPANRVAVLGVGFPSSSVNMSSRSRRSRSFPRRGALSRYAHMGADPLGGTAVVDHRAPLHGRPARVAVTETPPRPCGAPWVSGGVRNGATRISDQRTLTCLMAYNSVTACQIGARTSPMRQYPKKGTTKCSDNSSLSSQCCQA